MLAEDVNVLIEPVVDSIVFNLAPAEDVKVFRLDVVDSIALILLVWFKSVVASDELNVV